MICNLYFFLGFKQIAESAVVIPHSEIYTGKTQNRYNNIINPKICVIDLWGV